ncbi:MAG: hypothetical protein KAV87_29140 [Desulfobacteraceae bacterium]|nr:hypothetical protein [Desulfobacteraceae bacterium]
MVRGKKEYALEEWKVAMENARHFNDLLIRLRMLGLPMVITLFIAGIAAAHLVDNIELWKWAMPLFLATLSLFGIGAIIWHTKNKGRFKIKRAENKREHEENQSPSLPFSFFELVCWVIFVSIISASSANNLIALVTNRETLSFLNVSSVSITPLAILPAVVLLVALYSMDRFYYYELLIGAVNRLSGLEKDLSYSITDTTSRFIPRDRATNLVTFFYGLPGITLLVIFCLSLR